MHQAHAAAVLVRNHYMIRGTGACYIQVCFYSVCHSTMCSAGSNHTNHIHLKGQPLHIQQAAEYMYTYLVPVYDA